MLTHVSYQPGKEIIIMKERALLHLWSFNDGRTNPHLKKEKKKTFCVETEI